eukprot:CAMPEP_0171337926 /NCGR_PEP_ID=MMETSP0878-20121228/6994_1 /TAXON_ID=67004 /ORGANISM="Thalassiosira weissflogii, Strain CCMP1336" /LENGTH=54 /DNA_ID=CAMNT_0011839615 /DNA_START=432 /DNA_END=596 /DNA_ORIENTATION=-
MSLFLLSEEDENSSNDRTVSLGLTIVITSASGNEFPRPVLGLSSLEFMESSGAS